ncbi:MAG: MMPL family transporter [Pirellulales bacterium]
MGRESTQSELQPTFYDRWGKAILLLTMLLVPGIFYSAGKAVQSNVNKVEDWLPKTFEETKQLGWFRKHFMSDQFIIISWDGCKLGTNAGEDDPRIERLAKLLVPDSPDALQGQAAALVDQASPDPLPPLSDELLAGRERYFKSVTTGRRVLERLQGPPLSIDNAEAMKRLSGSLVGPDGKQTCVVVTLNSEAVRELKGLMGSGQRRIFRPNVPPGVIHRIVEAAGIPAEAVHFGGPPVDNAAIDEEGERTLVRLAGVSGLLGLGLAWWALRSVLLTMVVFFCGVMSAAASLGTVWLTGEHIDAIMMSMPSLVYVLAISGAVHLINYYRDAIEEGGLHGAAERAVMHAWKPALLCSTTTALGLVSLYASELVPIRKFGVYSACGMMTLLGILYLYLPAALHYLRIGKRWVDAGQLKRKVEVRAVCKGLPEPSGFGEQMWRYVSTKIVNNHALVMTACLGMIAIVGFGLTKNRTSINLLELFDKNARILQDYRWLEGNLGVLVPMELVVKFDPNNRLNGDANNHEAEEDLFKLTFLERMETIARVQSIIKDQFGESGAGIVGPSMSAVSFGPPLPDASGNTASFVHRKALNMRLESSQAEFDKAGFLKIDPEDGSELWRISLRVAAFKGVDYGKFVDDIRGAVQPVIQAHIDRDRILRQLSEWSPNKNYAGSKIVLWDRTGESSGKDRQAMVDPNVKTMSDLLVKARCRVTTVKVDPASIPLTQLETLKGQDAVVLVGSFTDADLRTIGGALPRTILVGEQDLTGSTARGLVTPLAIRNRDVALEAVYTGVVPIVYKAQRALLDSLITSTMWSFLTITPLMMFVSRSFRAGLVAMIPNVLPVVVIFGAMGWMDVPIDIGSMMTASIALGVAVDDTIHFLSWYRDDIDRIGNRHDAIIASYQKCGTPTLQAALISGLGLSVFALSTFTPTQRFGWLMLSILVAGVVSELIMLPALLAGPLGKVFTPAVKRHALPSRLYLIARYRIRRWMHESSPDPIVRADRRVA